MKAIVPVRFFSELTSGWHGLRDADCCIAQFALALFQIQKPQSSPKAIQSLDAACSHQIIRLYPLEGNTPSTLPTPLPFMNVLFEPSLTRFSGRGGN